MYRANTDSTSPARCNTSGFTLMELMISIAIFASIAVITFTGITQVQRAHDQNEKQMDRLQEVQLGLRKLEQDFSHVIGRSVRNENNENEKAFESRHLSEWYIRFTRAGIDPVLNPGKSDLLRVNYEFRDGKLYRQVWFGLDRTSKTGSEKYVILSNIKEMRVRYVDDKGQQHEDWPPPPGAGNPPVADAVPAAIWLHIEFNDWGLVSRVILIKETT